MNSNQFTMKMAGHIIEVATPSPRTFNFCWDYLCDGKPDIKIQVSEEEAKGEIDEARALLLKPGEKESFAFEENGRSVYISRIDDIYFETVAAYRKIVDALINYDIFLMHGAVVTIGNEAFMFSAPSGTGKTTHITQWLNKMESAFVVNGDKPLIKLTDSQAIACGTPWCGKERLGTNTMVPLKAIVFMERSEDNHIEEISFLQAYPYLLQQAHIPSDAEKAKKTLDLISKLYGKVSFWRFQCNNFKDDCFDVAYNALVKGQK